MDYEVAGDILWVPLMDIFVDPEFNCRGRFQPQEVHDLGQDIKKQGQIAPLIIQPIKDVPDNERPDPCDWFFRLVAGHRRYMAIDYWTSETRAKCCIERGLTGKQAHALNLVENLKRHDLNMLQEAHGIVETWPGYEIKDIAHLVGEPKRWVETRLSLLDLPDYVQQKAASGQLSQYDIRILASVPVDQIELMFQKIITTKGKRGQRSVTRSKQPWRNRSRGKEEIQAMISFLSANHPLSNLSDDNRDSVNSALAWTGKGLTSQEFLEDRLGFPPGYAIIDETDKVSPPRYN